MCILSFMVELRTNTQNFGPRLVEWKRIFDQQSVCSIIFYVIVSDVIYVTQTSLCRHYIISALMGPICHSSAISVCHPYISQAITLSHIVLFGAFHFGKSGTISEGFLNPFLKTCTIWFVSFIETDTTTCLFFSSPNHALKAKNSFISIDTAH